MTTRMKWTATVLVLAIGLMAGTAAAQKGSDDIAAVGTFKGIQSSPGNCVTINEMCYGNTFVLKSHGEWESYHLTVSLNYSTSKFLPNNWVVSGGTWSMVVFRYDQYAGTLYGEVQSGNMSLVTNGNGDPVARRMQANLTSQGGFGIFEGRAGRGISGAYDMIYELRSEETSGAANFNF